MGCSVDAAPYLDDKCSGKQTCEYTVPDKKLLKTKPCQYFESYLEIDYTCIKGKQNITLNFMFCK